MNGNDLPYTLEQLLDNRNRALYEQVSKRMPVQLELSKDDGWGSLVGDTEALIYCRESAYPIASFTHELLHMKLELSGMKKHEMFHQNQPCIKDDAQFFFNQLAHHKMFSDFLAMGFRADEFLEDNDTMKIDKHLNKDLRKLESKGRPTKSLKVAQMYFSIKSPDDNRPVMKEFEARLRRVSDPTMISTLDAILVEWVQGQSLDVRFPLARIFKCVGMPTIGFSLLRSQTDLILAQNA